MCIVNRVHQQEVGRVRLGLTDPSVKSCLLNQISFCWPPPRNLKIFRVSLRRGYIWWALTVNVIKTILIKLKIVYWLNCYLINDYLSLNLLSKNLISGTDISNRFPILKNNINLWIKLIMKRDRGYSYLFIWKQKTNKNFAQNR